MTRLGPRPRDAAENPLPSDVVEPEEAAAIVARLEALLGPEHARRYLAEWFPAWVPVTRPGSLDG